MGCGSSTAAGGSAPVERDPEDFYVEKVDFKPLGIPDYDELAEELEEPVNTLVEIINDINDAITDVKDAAAVVIGAYRVEIKTEDAKNVDTVLLSLTKADGTWPAKADVEAIASKLASADDALSKAKEALYQAMQASPVSLKVNADLLTTAGACAAEVEAFNKALTGFRTAAGAGFKVNLSVKAAGKLGSPGVTARIVKPVFKNEGEHYDLVAVSLLDVAKTAEAKNITAAEGTVAETLGAVAKVLADMPEGTFTFSIKKKKLVVTFPKKAPAPAAAEPAAEPVAEAEEDEAAEEKPKASKPKPSPEDEKLKEKQSALRKSVTTANGQLFKLNKACANINGSLNIGRAVVILVEKIKEHLIKKAQKSADEVMKLITIKPSIKVTDDGELDFDLGLKINLPEFENLDLEAIVMQLLPGPAKHVYRTIMDMVNNMKETFPKFSELKDQVQQAVEKAEQVFEGNQMDKIKEAYPDVSPLEIPKIAGKVASNLKAIKGCADVAKKGIMTVKRVGDELKATVETLQKEFGQQ